MANPLLSVTISGGQGNTCGWEDFHGEGDVVLARAATDKVSVDVGNGALFGLSSLLQAAASAMTASTTDSANL